MPVQINPESALGRELWKWDHTTREIHPADEEKPRHEQLHGVRPTSFQAFPKMLYKAMKHPLSGKAICVEGEPQAMFFADAAEFARACLLVSTLNNQCQLTVGNEEELEKAKREGWSHSPPDALARFEGYQQDIAKAAAEMNFGVARMSPRAQAEHAAASNATDEHVVDVKPRRKRGRPTKAQPIPVTGSGEVESEG